VRPRYIGIENTDGDIIFVVDADAIYEKEYVELCVKHLRDKKTGGVIGKIRVWDRRRSSPNTGMCSTGSVLMMRRISGKR